MAIELLINMLDIARILANQHWSEILDRAPDRSRLPLKGRLTPSEKPHLVGDDLNEDPIPHLCVNDNRLNIGDFHRPDGFSNVGGNRRVPHVRLSVSGPKMMGAALRSLSPHRLTDS